MDLITRDRLKERLRELDPYDRDYPNAVRDQFRKLIDIVGDMLDYMYEFRIEVDG